jgi:N-acetylglucosamine kinase-like BadF-type ATPase
MLVIGVDLGGTGARAALADNGHVLAQTELLGVTDRVQTVIDLVAELLNRTHLHKVDTIAVGATGFAMTGKQLRELLPGKLLPLTGKLLLCSDMVSSYVGALGLAPGAVLAAGTGAVALGTDLRGTWSRVDGWGYLTGDLGGGSWIGRSALTAALRFADKRPNGSGPLLTALRDQFGEPAELIAQLNERPDRAGVMASFVPGVKAAALDGDPVAGEIFRQAGQHLAETALAALLPGSPRVVALTGNLFQAGKLLLDPLTQGLAGTDLRRAKGSGVDGALLLASAPKLPPATPCELFTS